MMFTWLLNEKPQMPRVICFFFILQEAVSKTEEYPGNEVKVKEKKTMFTSKLGLLQIH